MKITVDWAYYTDGDFSMRENPFFKFKYDGDETYSGVEIFENEDETRAKMEARSYLEQLLCESHVSYTHYYILEDLYKMFEAGMDFLYNKDGETVFHKEITGNYDGTYLHIIFIE